MTPLAPEPQGEKASRNHGDGGDCGSIGGDALDGEEVVVVDGDGDRVAWNDVWTGGPSVEPGDYVHVDGRGSDCALNEVSEGEVYRVVHAPADSDASTVLAEREIPSPPDSPVPTDTC